MSKGSGGGGSSGNVTWPAYFTQWHEALLGSGTTMALDTNVAGEIIAASKNNPFSGKVAYDPETPTEEMKAKVDSYWNAIMAINPDTEWHDAAVTVRAAIGDHVFDEATIAATIAAIKASINTEAAEKSAALVAFGGALPSDLAAIEAAENAFNAIVDANMDTMELPKFQRGMQDINAVISSSYVTGAALLASESIRKKAEFSANLRLQDYKIGREYTGEVYKLGSAMYVKAFEQTVDSIRLLRSNAYRDETLAVLQGVKDIVTRNAQVADFMRIGASLRIETERIVLTAYKEEIEAQIKIDESEAKWKLDVLSSAGNLLASGHGAVSQTNAKGNMMQSVLGGALSGASIGASTWNPILTLGGGVIGGLMGASSAA
jgi:hypothetical protein